MTNENFYCKFEIYKVVQTTEHGLTYEVEQHVMWVTAETEAEFLMWDKAVKQTDSDHAALEDPGGLLVANALTRSVAVVKAQR